MFVVRSSSGIRSLVLLEVGYYIFKAGYAWKRSTSVVTCVWFTEHSKENSQFNDA